MLFTLIKLANELDSIGQYRFANAIDLLIKNAIKADKLPTKKQYPLIPGGDDYSDTSDQKAEVTEELNEELEARDMEGYTPGNDNLIIDKNNNPTDGFGVLAKLKDNAILLKGRNKRRKLLAMLRKI